MLEKGRQFCHDKMNFPSTKLSYLLLLQNFSIFTCFAKSCGSKPEISFTAESVCCCKNQRQFSHWEGYFAAVKLSYLCSCRKLSLRTARLQRQTQVVNMHFSVINYCSYNCGSDSLLLWSGLVAALGALAALWYPTASRLFAVA